MIDLILKLIEYAGKIPGIRESNRREYFDRYVQPAYETAEQIYADYRAMLVELQDLVEKSPAPQPIIDLLEARRSTYLAARTRLRALITQRLREGRATRFEAGILGLMSGVVTSVDRPYFQMYAYAGADGDILPQLGRHTILDILQKLEGQDAADLETVRPQLQAAIAKKSAGIAQAWQNVVSGYAELHAGTLPQPLPRVRRRKVRQVDKIPAVQALLIDIHHMLDSGQFDRRTAVDFEAQVAAALPQLSSLAQEVRETMHDLDNKEPNVTPATLCEDLARFEQALDKVLRAVLQEGA